MLFAAGPGSRLRPLTDRMPKALVPVGGVPVLERVARRLVAAGADRLIINTHGFDREIRDFVRDRAGFDADIRFSHEPDAPLETGGGLLHAAPHFRRDAPFFLHSTDVLTELPLDRLYAEHQAAAPTATLAVNRRDAARYLLFDDDGLFGHLQAAGGTVTTARPPAGETRRLAFCGVHVLSPEIFDLIHERGAFPIMRLYLRLAGQGRRILPFEIGDAAWFDIGTHQRLARAEAHFAGAR